MIDDDVRGKGGDGRYQKYAVQYLCVCNMYLKNMLQFKSFICDVNIHCIHEFHFCFIGKSKHGQLKQS